MWRFLPHLRHLCHFGCDHQDPLRGWPLRHTIAAVKLARLLAHRLNLVLVLFAATDQKVGAIMYWKGGNQQDRKVAGKFPEFLEFSVRILPRIFPEFFEDFSCFVSWETETRKNSPKIPAIFNAKFPGKHRKNIHKTLLESRQSKDFSGENWKFDLFLAHWLRLWLKY